LKLIDISIISIFVTIQLPFEIAVVAFLFIVFCLEKIGANQK